MKVGLHQFTTPHEDAIAFAPDWRARMAVALAEHRGFIPRLVAYHEDKLLMSYSRFIKAGRKQFIGDGTPYDFQLTDQLHAGPLRVVIDAYLLTEAPLDDIAVTLQLKPAEVGAYGGLFFDVRDAHGKTQTYVEPDCL